ncbi:site-2 protease family protein [Thermopolyspora sp. NPDC052614]|uniref:site-2 protease family protein n=1 Tax=Thermopolyspora sp. NPDC052614 TaxID=3155682 RepID=UPI00342B82BB
MRQHLLLWRADGVRVGLHCSAMVVVPLIAVTLSDVVLPHAVPGRNPALYWTAGVAMTAAFCASLLAHGAAQAVAARRGGLRVRSITLWFLGAIVECEDDPPNPRAELAIGVAGPLAGLAVTSVFLTATWLVATFLPPPGLRAAALAWAAAVNAVLVAANLLPGAPLDGGRILRAVVWWRRHDRARAERAAIKAGRALGLALIVAGLAGLLAWAPAAGLWLVVTGWVLASAAYTEEVARTHREALGATTVRDVMTRVSAPHHVAPAHLSVRDFAAILAAGSDRTAFPVVDATSAMPVGYVTLGMLASVPCARRTQTLIGEVRRDLPAERVVHPSEPAARLLSLRALPGVGRAGDELVAVVVEGREVVGMVTTADVDRALGRGPEQGGPDRGVPERNGPERSGPERSGPERNGPERSGPERNGPERSGPERSEPERGGSAQGAERALGRTRTGEAWTGGARMGGGRRAGSRTA